MVKKKTSRKKSTPRKPRKPKNLPPLALFAKANEVVEVVQKLSERDRYKVLGLARDVLNEDEVW